MQFASRYVADPRTSTVFSSLRPESMGQLRNPEAFAGALAFDVWTENTDGQQALYYRRQRERKITVAFIDFGHCFRAGTWSLPDSVAPAIHRRGVAAQTALRWRSFEPWLRKIENMRPSGIRAIVRSVPAEWCRESLSAEAKTEILMSRARRVREWVVELQHDRKKSIVLGTEIGRLRGPANVSLSAAAA
jgi:hypothetical protein